MMLRSLLLALVALTTAAAADAQVLRYHTSVGSFDMLLNPTGNANLQPLVDNMLAYVESNRYWGGAINRAADGNAGDPTDDFVLQMGGFALSRTSDVDSTDPFVAVDRFDPVIVDANGDNQVDFDTTGLSNIRGAVSLALAGGNVNSGTSSFFINVGNNEFLDSQGFVPFAYVQDMTVVDRIMALRQVSLDPSLTFTDVPFLADENVPVLYSVEVVGQASTLEGPLGPAAQTDVQRELLEQLNNASASVPAPTPASNNASSGGSSIATPEPSTAMLALLGGMAALAARRRG